jgi:hypothetical protein
MSDSSIDASICPLCGGPNLCPAVADPDVKGCWCGDKFFPPELLAQVPEQFARKACICQNCLENFIDSKGVRTLPS